MENVAEDPSDSDRRAYLERHQPHYAIDRRKHARYLGDITLLGIVGPTAAGKSTLMRRVIALDPDIHPYESSTTRPRSPRDGTDYRTDVPLKEFYDAVKDESLINYFVHPNGHVYGTFLDGVKPPVTIGAIATDTLLQLSDAGFYDCRIAYTAMDGQTYADRLGLSNPERFDSRLRQPDILPRLQEGLSSLAFARMNLDQQWLSAIQLSNEPGSLDRSAADIARLAHQRTFPTLSTSHALGLLSEMEDVARQAIDRVSSVQ
ncbi:hypothetical protein CL689_00310 [Candidatus Saccharibacteria bacterium]|nr:hypothetical protein [Candidatus Saccharibacteria bacterium]MBJ58854.1 hypothetical protein [Candidatus Saccharibacteria bacterium]MBQ68492.1 hypothetical protein [Candidatus Saccharibacteria bacterium]|tara:strand:+ start:2597 stop:3379 length:783 start_codon:yes stop_codon:yes gene_type:complete